MNQELKNHETGICANCGADNGLHNSETDQCPKNGMEISMSAWDRGERQQWEDTHFEDSGLKRLNDAAPDLLEALKDVMEVQGGWLKDTYPEIYNQAEAAISKALSPQ